MGKSDFQINQKLKVHSKVLKNKEILYLKMQITDSRVYTIFYFYM